MKKILYITSVFISILATGCSEEFLEFTPEDRIAVDDFWTSENDVNVAVIGCYDALQADSYYGFDMFVFGDVKADNNFAGGDNPNNFAINNYSVFPTNQVVTRFFQQVYKGIGRTNTVIDRTHDMEDDLFEEGRKETLLGEAHFLRGLHYFNLVQLYGGVPLALNEVQSFDVLDDLKIPRNSETEVYQQIIDDLETAISFLEGKDQPLGRATVGAAESLLSKVYLTLGDYSQVVTLTSNVLTRGYALESRFDDLFNQENKNNSEVIFAVRYAGETDGNPFPELVLPTPEANFGFIKFNTPTPNSIEQFETGDRRAGSSFVERGNTSYIYKWRNGEAFLSSDYNIVLRYADVLLMRAEALNQTESTPDNAITLLNQIRNRAGLSGYSGPIDDLNAVDQAIFEERRVELMYEGHRWFDLKRKGFETARDAIAEAKGITIEPFEMVLPIPQEERDKNDLLLQNPNY